ncbi:MAG: hypothetical protein Q4E06_13140 [Lautropia sp.]|nr:hypothetical protein [Lautropia sp.]
MSDRAVEWLGGPNAGWMSRRCRALKTIVIQQLSPSDRRMKQKFSMHGYPIMLHCGIVRVFRLQNPL